MQRHIAPKIILTPPSRERAEAAAREIAKRKIVNNTSRQELNAWDQIAKLAGQKPQYWVKPKYGTLEYCLAHNCGWISESEFQADKALQEERSKRARRTSHRPKNWGFEDELRYEQPKETDEYIPEMSMKLIKDRNLNDSARRIALFLVRHTYQDNRKERALGTTVSFIMKGLALSRSTVQRALALLVDTGYIERFVATNNKTKMCRGLLIRLLSPLFPKQYKEKWPETLRNPDASQTTHNHRFQIYIKESHSFIDAKAWMVRCMDGVLRSFLRYNPLPDIKSPI